MKHLTSLQILVCHDENVRRYGGCPGTADPSRVDALVHRVRNHERYEDVTDVFDLAALYCVAIERGHVFTDGNKRTAINCTYAFLKQNGVQTHLPTDLEAMVLRVATGEVSAPDFGAYLRRAFAKPGA